MTVISRIVPICRSSASKGALSCLSRSTGSSVVASTSSSSSFATVTSHPSHPSNPPTPPATTSTNSNSSSSSTSQSKSSHKVLIVGGGAAGQSISHQLLRSNKFSPQDVAIVDPSATHDYQPGWTLVGGGLKNKEDLRKDMKDLIGDQIKWYRESVESFQPESNSLTTKEGSTISYDQLVVCPGLHVNFAGIKGLESALKENEKSGVSSIYGYDTCSNLYPQINALKSGKAIFTQPAGVVKCAGAPQKAMWLALDHWKQEGQFKRSDSSTSSTGVEITFATGMPSMFSVPKYSDILNSLRQERGVTGLFQHNLTSIDSSKKVATFSKLDDKTEVYLDYDLLHVTPPMKAYSFVAESPLADKASGFVDVSQATTQHNKYPNVWSIGDSSSLATSKTAAAVTAEAPVLVGNLLAKMEGRNFEEEYDGYTSCPLLTEYGKVLLAEFTYGGVPKETFTPLGLDQSVPRRAFYHLKKDFFPWIYYNSMVKGTWAGPKGFLSAPSTSRSLSTYTRPTISSSSSNKARNFSTSSIASRNSPSRRPRDPLQTDSSAQRATLEDGSFFISRPPPTVPSNESTVFSAHPFLSNNQNTEVSSSSSFLPPPLKPRTRKVSRTIRNDLSSEEISKLQAFRETGASVNETAREFNCSSAFVSIVAPDQSGKAGELEKLRQAEEKSTWGWNKRVSRELRGARKEQW